MAIKIVKKPIQIACALIISNMLIGCASNPQQPFNKPTNEQIKTIGLLSPSSPNDYNIKILHSIAGAFGLIGGIVEETSNANKSNQFKKSVGDVTRISKQLDNEIVQSLEAANYKVINIPVKREKQDFLPNYSVVQSNADAYLDVVIENVGYFANDPFSPYIPTLRVKAHLVSAKDNKVLFSENLTYGEEWPGKKSIDIPSPDKYSYKSFNDLLANANEAREGLTYGIRPLATQLASELK